MKTLEKITLGSTVATPKGLGLVMGFGECVGSVLVELETGEKVEFLDRELRFLSK